MADLLTHVLVAYVLATLASIRYEWISPAHVTAAMAGAMIPDLNRLELVVPPELVESAVGIPISWTAFHTLGGSLLVVAIGVLCVPREYRRGVAAMALLGMASHHALDLLVTNPTGHTYPVLWPLSAYHPPTPGLYLSSDRWPAAVAGVAAAAAWYLRYRR